MQLAALIERAALLHPTRVAAVEGEIALTYGELATRVRALSGWLARRGVASGTPVAVLELNSVAFLEAYFACARLGAIAVPLNFRLSAEEIAFILSDAGARVLLAGPSFATRVSDLFARAVRLESLLWLGAKPSGAPGHELAEVASHSDDDVGVAELGPDAVAQLYYTSGTTGRPKGVMLTHGNVSMHALAAIAELSLDEADVWAHAAPMFHLADAWATFAITWVGGKHVMLPRFDEESFFAAVARERVTLTNLIPTMLARLVRHPAAARTDLTSLRRILSGGAPIAPELVREIMRVFGCEYVQTYGMTETSPYLTLSLLTERLKALPAEEQFTYRAKTGRPFLAVELDVVGEDGRSVPRDGATVGEIRARGPTVTPGYWNRPDETARAFADGWLLTGDLATVDAEGYLQIVDRKKDMIITGGEKVFSTEVEHVLYAHPSVLEAAVFAVPDPEWGERVRAAVALRPELTLCADARAKELELIEFCRARLAHFKCPSSIEFWPELPKTGSAKIQKRALRDPHWNAPRAAPPTS